MEADGNEVKKQQSHHHHKSKNQTHEHSKAMEPMQKKPLTFRDFKDFNEFLKTSRKQFNENLSKKFVYKETLEDFDLFCTLEQGNFGELVLVKLKNTEKYSSMIVMEKLSLITKDHLEFIKREKKILESLHSPFAIHLESFFQDNFYIYFIIPYYPLKLVDVLSEFGRLDEDTAKFYMSQIVLALEHLHYLDLIFRNLKPENILIIEDGYVKLTNFCLCKHLNENHKRTYSFCGTLEYLAPEVILSKGCGFYSDWWGFGAVTYELVAGRSPFRAKKGDEDIIVLRKIVDNKYTIPKHFSCELKDLIKRVLNPDLTMRFGNLKAGVNDIKYHKWFRTISWLSMLNRTTPPPVTSTKPTNICEKERNWRPHESPSIDIFKEVFKDI